MTTRDEPAFVAILRDDGRYPPAPAAYLGAAAPAAIVARGNLAALQGRTLALFCSVRCPGELILRTYDLACALREAGVTVAGGFHAPMERECLRLLLRGKQQIIVCPARGIEALRLPATWQAPLDEGRLLVLSPFPHGPRRAGADLAHRRNLFVAALADVVLIAHTAPGGKMEQVAAMVLSWGKPLFTLESEHNAHLIALGARLAGIVDIPQLL